MSEEKEKTTKPKAKIKFKYKGIELVDTSYVKDHDYSKYQKKRINKKILPTMQEVLY